MGKNADSVIHEMGEELREFFNENFLDPDPKARLEEQLRTLYGRGEINKDLFLELRVRLHQGLVSKTDL
jgi:hypothetical protein